MKVDNRLRCVDDSVGVRNLHRKPLKKLLINRVEKPLFLGEVVDGRSGAFYCDVEVIEATKKTVTAKRLRREGINHFLDFIGDDVAAGKVRVVEDGAQDAFGQ